MNKVEPVQRWGRVALAGLLLGPLGAAWAEVVADPPRLSFVSETESHTVRLSDGGSPLAAKDIKGWKFMAEDSNYAHMMTLTPVEGGFTLKPTSTVEVGSFDLTLDTTRGPVTVPVATPLSGEADVVQEAGWTDAQQKREVELRMGVASRLAREQVSFELAPRYYEGQTLIIEQQARPGHVYSWSVNGKTVAEGPNEATLRYTFPKPGEYIVNYTETATDQHRSFTVAQTESQTEVVALEPTAVTCKAGGTVKFTGPKGYAKFAWTVDGKVVEGEGGNLTQRFATPGSYTVECLGTEPLEGVASGFVRNIYSVEVTPK